MKMRRRLMLACAASFTMTSPTMRGGDGDEAFAREGLNSLRLRENGKIQLLLRETSFSA
jgi:hypothetical protein